MAIRSARRESPLILAVILTIGYLVICWTAEISLAVNHDEETPSTPKEPSVKSRETGVEQKRELGQPKKSSPLQSNRDAFSQESIVMTYRIIGTVRVKDDSSEGFSREEARRALQAEAFRHFGTKAKGIANIQYKQKTGAPPIPDRLSEASGDVVTWDEGIPASQRETEISLAPAQLDTGTGAGDSSIETSSIPRQPSETEKTDLYSSPLPADTPQGISPRESIPIASPRSILILSNRDLIDHNFWVLGKVVVDAESRDFGVEEANQALKVEAFKRFGGQAQGITNINYKKERGLLKWRAKISEASGDVVAWQASKTAASLRPISSHRAASDVSEPRPVSEVPDESRSPMDILVLSANDLFTINFRSLGSVAVRDNSKEGFTKRRAINALQIEAFKRYGSQVRGIANIEYKDEMTILHGSKISEAYADAVTWKGDQKIYQEARMAPPPSPYYDDALEEDGRPAYVTRTVRSGQIAIIKDEETLSDKYKELGAIAVMSPTRHGFEKSEADRALRKKAFKEFGGEAWGIINVDYEKASCLKCEGKFWSATGMVVSR
jgi:hypothetical protein